MYNFVTTSVISNFFKGSKYFKRDMGFSITSSASGEKKIDLSDTFLKFYNSKHGTLPKKEGNIGSISFYTDFYIKGDIIGVFHKGNDYIFECDMNKIRNVNIDSYIGDIIKEIETKYNDEDLDVVTEDKEAGDPNMVFKNPGAVTYADMKAYLKNKNKI